MKSKHRIIFFLVCFLISYTFFHFYTDDYLLRKAYLAESTDNMIVENGIVNYDTWTLRQKIAHMIVIRGDKQDLRYNYLNVGGIFLDNQYSIASYQQLIEKYQANAPVELFVATDLEGAWNPFSEIRDPDYAFPAFSDITSAEEAYDIGVDHSRVLDSVGFNFNFAPVAEFSDSVYGGRVFHGTKEEISEKIGLYIQGLKLKRVRSTCKHYPGRAMEANLHIVSDSQEITQHDLDLFLTCYRNNVSAVMVSHQIVSGALDSGGRPSSVSPQIVGTIPSDVLIVVDEVNMRSLSTYYDDKADMYVDLINAGNDVILDFDLNSLELYSLLLSLEAAVHDGRLSEERIDESVHKILTEKGYFVR